MATPAPSFQRQEKATLEDASLKNVDKTDHADSANVSRVHHIMWLVSCVAILPCFLWSYWPTLVHVTSQWESQPDYSHGYFVIPVALFFLWVRRDRFPGIKGGLAWSGLIFLVLSIGLRYLGAHYYLGSVDAWSMILWWAGVVYFLCGAAVLRWALPSLLFLFFMIPLPYGGERLLSVPLQKMATHISSIGLRFLGQPALVEGNTIVIGDAHLEVAQACSGLRIFIGILALAFVYLVIFQRPLWQKIFIVAISIPIALLANSLRIITTGILYTYVSSDTAHLFGHDIAGFCMIPLAAVFFASVLWYLNRAFYEVEEVQLKSLLRRPPKARS